MKAIKRILSAIKDDLDEYYLLVLVVLGVPAIGWMYVDFKLFVALSISIQAIIGILYFTKKGA